MTRADEGPAADLDTRPGGEMRGTMTYWVQQCPSCGYCAPSLAEGAPSARRVVRAAAYQSLLSGASLPELARRFVCSSVALEHSAAFADAGWQAVYAAWVCDDAGLAHEAVECRSRALELFDKAVQVRQAITEAPAEMEAVRADLLRRCGRHDEALARCDAGLSLDPASVVRAVLSYEAALAMRSDIAVHTVDEALAYGPVEA